MFFAIVCLSISDGFWQIRSHIRENTENATVKSTLEDIAIATTVQECSLLHSSMLRAGLSILGALGKFYSSGPPRAIHAEAIVHYSTIRK